LRGFEKMLSAIEARRTLFFGGVGFSKFGILGIRVIFS